MSLKRIPIAAFAPALALGLGLASGCATSTSEHPVIDRMTRPFHRDKEAANGAVGDGPVLDNCDAPGSVPPPGSHVLGEDGQPPLLPQRLVPRSQQPPPYSP